MYAGEVGECCSGDERVVPARGGGHEPEDDCGGCETGACGDRNYASAIAPVELMTLSEEFGRVGAECAASIEDSVEDVDGPGAGSKEECDPGLQRDVGCAGDGVGPYDGDSGSVEAQQMPCGKKMSAKAAHLHLPERVGLAV